MLQNGWKGLPQSPSAGHTSHPQTSCKNLTKQQFKVCYDQYFDSIRSYLYFRSGNAELSTDLAQEVFLKLWEKKGSFEARNLKGLLYKMANDLFISSIRREKVATKYLDRLKLDLYAENPEEVFQYQELKDQYEKALATLPEKQRVVYLMSRLEALTYKEIAARLGLSVKAVEKRMGQALGRLRKQLNDHA